VDASAIANGGSRLLAPYTKSEHRVSCFLMHQLGLYVQIVLALTATLWSQPASAVSADGRCAVSMLALLFLATSLVVLQPLRPESSWYLPVQVHSLVAASLNALLAGAIYGSDSVNDGTVALSYLAFAATASLAFTLVLCFLMSLWVGAQVESKVPAGRLLALGNWGAAKASVLALLRGTAPLGRGNDGASDGHTGDANGLNLAGAKPGSANGPGRAATQADEHSSATAQRVISRRPDSMDARVAFKAVRRQQGGTAAARTDLYRGASRK
jgi:hypothetical protein